MHLKNHTKFINYIPGKQTGPEEDVRHCDMFAKATGSDNDELILEDD